MYFFRMFFVSAECGISKVIQKRMVNGAKASPGAWPWMASIQFYGISVEEHLYRQNG